MRILIQRVKEAAVSVCDDVIGAIGPGVLALVGFDKEDNAQRLARMLEKTLSYRVFPDTQGHMNLSLRDTGGGLLIVSQFTLVANTRKGRRPSFSSAAPPDMAQALYDEFVELAHVQYDVVETGRFGADMQVRLINDGPVTFLLEN